MTDIDAPVSLENRLNYMDVLRGFAVMAIFIVNIKAMAAPFAYYANATLWAGDHDQLIAQMQAFLVDNKWRTNFTALFGAGLVLITEKSMAAGSNPATRLRRRMVWLLIFGLIHLLFIWSGDILTLYALTGFLALLFRNKSTGGLVLWATICLVVGMIWTSGFGMWPAFDKALSTELGGKFWGTDPELLQKEIDTFLGSIADHTMYRLFSMIGYIGFYFLIGGFWLLTLGIMLAGMALFKSGFLRGLWSGRTYFLLACLGLGSAWAIEYYRLGYINANDWAFESSSLMMPFAMAAGLLGAFGYAALVGALLKTGMKLSPVAAAGRMAFTNYIACSLIGTTIAYGHAGGLFGSLTLAQLMMIVGATFIGMLIWSPLWLSIFRFGPLEWLWRSLTYGKVQPLLK